MKYQACNKKSIQPPVIQTSLHQLAPAPNKSSYTLSNNQPLQLQPILHEEDNADEQWVVPMGHSAMTQPCDSPTSAPRTTTPIKNLTLQSSTDGPTHPENWISASPWWIITPEWGERGNTQQTHP